MKKIINDPNAVARETVEGLAAAFPQYVRQLSDLKVLVRADAPVDGNVAVLTGGGSGHEPMFLGYVGKGMAAASVAGDVFTSPPPDPIIEAAKAVHGGKGVLFVYGNYSGDVLNFDMAAEIIADEGLQVETVRVTDDVVSAPAREWEQRRGVAGDLFVIKVAGAAAEEGLDLSQTRAAAAKANRMTRSMSVALSSCIIPASGSPIFEISEEEMEIGLGLHGEPGVERGRIQSADNVAEQLVDRILSDLKVESGEEVGVLINGLGGTPLAELFIVFRAVDSILKRHGISIVRSWVGNYATSLEMAGCSVTIIRLEEDLKRWLLAPCETSALVQV